MKYGAIHLRLSDQGQILDKRRKRISILYVVNLVLFGVLATSLYVNRGLWGKLTPLTPFWRLFATKNSGPAHTDIFDVSELLPEYHQSALVGSVVLVENHEFNNSYGRPFEGHYSPPKNVTFNRARLSFNASTYGRQFDRLAHLFVGDQELWRLSTAEPGNKNITFGASKDVNKYANLFAQEQDVKFILNNIVNDVYTGPITLFLKVDLYYVESGDKDELFKYDLPVQRPSSNSKSLTQGGLLYAPQDLNDSVTVNSLPRNTTRAVVEVFASGNADEEFWYSHIADPYNAQFDSHLEFGPHGPIREIKVFINGVLAGTASPYSVIYTGGYSPLLWSPVVGTKAYDVPSYIIDITPFLPAIWDKDTFTVSFDIANNYQHNIADNWIVSANLLTWEAKGFIGSGKILYVEQRAPVKKALVSGATPRSVAQILNFATYTDHSTLLTFKGEDETPIDLLFEWKQSSSHHSVQSVSKHGEEHALVFKGKTESYINVVDIQPDRNISSNSSASEQSNLVYSFKYHTKDDRYDLSIVRSYEEEEEVNDAVVKSLHIKQNGTSKLKIHDRAASGKGELETKLKQREKDVTYSRKVVARHGVVASDEVWHDGEKTVASNWDRNKGVAEDYQYFVRLPGSPTTLDDN